MKRVTVFCGSNLGSDKNFQSQATFVGKTLAKNQIEVVYGGAKVGLMGALADGALSEGGRVIGILPKFLSSKEIVHNGLTELIMVDTMHERKTMMNELCDGVIALPGGFGTLEELFEMTTWAQLGLHKKPIGVLNTNGFYNALIVMIQTMVDNGFLKVENQKMILISDTIEDLLQQMKDYVAPKVNKWITKEEL